MPLKSCSSSLSAGILIKLFKVYRRKCQKLKFKSLWAPRLLAKNGSRFERPETEFWRWKGEFANFFYWLINAPNCDIIWTENGVVIDGFIPEKLTFKECSECVQHVSNKCWTRFKHRIESQYLWKEVINPIFVFGPNNVILRRHQIGQ